MTFPADHQLTSDSSPTSPVDASGVVYQNGVPTGPIQLPIEEAEEFVSEFNVTYSAKRLRLSLVATSNRTIKKATAE